MRPKSSTKKAVSKTCPACEHQVPVACKACPCGHTFYVKKGDLNGSGPEDSSAPKSPPPPGADSGSPNFTKLVSSNIDISPGRRRTERVKRERPNYFNALEFVNPTSRRRRTTSASQSSGTEEPVKKKRGRPRTNFSKPREEGGGGGGGGGGAGGGGGGGGGEKEKEKEEDAYANVPIQKVMQYAVILAEINRKLSTQTFRP